MRRRRVFLAVGVLILLTGTVLGILALLARHEPGFYARAAVQPGKVRESQSKAFLGEFWKLVNAVTNREPNWRFAFTEAQINSYFEEDFLVSGVADKLLPDDVTAPRIAIEQDRIRLAFRYGAPPWSTVVSINFRLWLAPKESNVVVLELQSVHAGALPISAQSLLEQLSEVLRRRNIEVTWYRHNAHPTAVLRFQTDQPRPTIQLRQLELKNGMLTVVGRSVEPLPRAVTGPRIEPPRGN
jgi:hypothetical protein